MNTIKKIFITIMLVMPMFLVSGCEENSVMDGWQPKKREQNETQPNKELLKQMQTISEQMQAISEQMQAISEQMRTISGQMRTISNKNYWGQVQVKQRWEYNVEHFSRDGILDGPGLFAHRLETLGDRGWEYAGTLINNGVNARYIVFKRPK